MGKLSFSGHESFICKQFWLKKGYDYAVKTDKFKGDQAVVELGVGKNMVSSIQFWLNAFGIYKKGTHKTTDLGNYLFGENGRDLYIEDLGTIWLLHYHLVKLEEASIYHLIFNEFRTHRIEFTKKQLHNFLRRVCEDNTSTPYNENTINRDMNVFLSSYLPPSKDKKQIEDSFASLLHELQLVKMTRSDNMDWYRIEGGSRADLPIQVVLFSILDNENYGDSISFKDLQVGLNSPGRIFALNTEGLYKKVKAISDHFEGINYSETAGNRVLQINSNLRENKWEILDDYYNA